MYCVRDVWAFVCTYTKLIWCVSKNFWRVGSMNYEVCVKCFTHTTAKNTKPNRFIFLDHWQLPYQQRRRLRVPAATGQYRRVASSSTHRCSTCTTAPRKVTSTATRLAPSSRSPDSRTTTSRKYGASISHDSAYLLRLNFNLISLCVLRRCFVFRKLFAAVPVLV